MKTQPHAVMDARVECEHGILCLVYPIGVSTMLGLHCMAVLHAVTWRCDN